MGLNKTKQLRKDEDDQKSWAKASSRNNQQTVWQQGKLCNNIQSPKDNLNKQTKQKNNAEEDMAIPKDVETSAASKEEASTLTNLLHFKELRHEVAGKKVNVKSSKRDASSFQKAPLKCLSSNSKVGGFVQKQSENRQKMARETTKDKGRIELKNNLPETIVAAAETADRNKTEQTANTKVNLFNCYVSIKRLNSEDYLAGTAKLSRGSFMKNKWNKPIIEKEISTPLHKGSPPVKKNENMKQPKYLHDNHKPLSASSGKKNFTHFKIVLPLSSSEESFKTDGESSDNEDKNVHPDRNTSFDIRERRQHTKIGMNSSYTIKSKDSDQNVPSDTKEVAEKCLSSGNKTSNKSAKNGITSSMKKSMLKNNGTKSDNVSVKKSKIKAESKYLNSSTESNAEKIKLVSELKGSAEHGTSNKKDINISSSSKGISNTLRVNDKDSNLAKKSKKRVTKRRSCEDRSFPSSFTVSTSNKFSVTATNVRTAGSGTVKNDFSMKQGPTTGSILDGRTAITKSATVLEQSTQAMKMESSCDKLSKVCNVSDAMGKAFGGSNKRKKETKNIGENSNDRVTKRASSFLNQVPEKLKAPPQPQTHNSSILGKTNNESKYSVSKKTKTKKKVSTKLPSDPNNKNKESKFSGCMQVKNLDESSAEKQHSKTRPAGRKKSSDDFCETTENSSRSTISLGKRTSNTVLKENSNSKKKKIKKIESLKSNICKRTEESHESQRKTSLKSDEQPFIANKRDSNRNSKYLPKVLDDNVVKLTKEVENTNFELAETVKFFVDTNSFSSSLFMNAKKLDGETSVMSKSLLDLSNELAENNLTIQKVLDRICDFDPEKLLNIISSVDNVQIGLRKSHVCDHGYHFPDTLVFFKTSGKSCDILYEINLET